MQVLWINNLLYSTALMCVKLSIVACYLRVFPNKRIFRKIIWANAVVIIALWICSIFVGIFQCNPPQAAWEVTFQGAHCIAIVNFYYPANSVNIVSDLVLCIAPLRIIWKLRVSKLERVFVIALFGFGFFATAASIARLVTLTRYILGGVDFPRYTSPTLIWSGVEIGVAIICASVTSLRPLLSRLAPRRSFVLTLSWKLSNPSWKSSKAYTSATSATMYSQHGLDPVSAKCEETDEYDLTECKSPQPRQQLSRARASFRARARRIPIGEPARSRLSAVPRQREPQCGTLPVIGRPQVWVGWPRRNLATSTRRTGQRHRPG